MFIRKTATSSATRETGQLINFNIRQFASTAKTLYKQNGLQAVRDEKEKLMDKFYNLLISAYGLIPETFDFEYVDKDGVYHIEKGFTPHLLKKNMSVIV